MKKISFVAAILVSAALAAACHKNKPAPTTPPAGGSDAGSGSAPAGSDAPAGGGSAAM